VGQLVADACKLARQWKGREADGKLNFLSDVLKQA
jgi:hypothetical protein